MASVLGHERSKTTDDQGHRTSNVVNLKNSKNHKVNNNYSFKDILSGDSKREAESEPIPIEPTKKYNSPASKSSEKEEAPNDFLDNLSGVDTSEEIPDNPGIMPEPTMPPATFTQAPLEVASSAPLPLMGSLSWTAPDKHHELISHAWRKGVIVILVAMAFLAFFWQESILTAITFFALALVTSMHFWREARHERYEIHPHGITIGGQFHHYHDLDSFWIHYHPEGFHELSLCTGRLLNHYIKIPLKGRDPFEVRDALMMYLPEERHEEGLEDLLRRKLGL